MSSKRTPRTRPETQQSLNDVRSAIQARPALGQQDLTEQRRRAATAIESVSEIQLDKTMQKFTQAGLEVNKLLGQVQAQFSESYAELKLVAEAVSAYRQELEDLYGKDVVQSNLTDVLSEHDNKVAALEQDLAERRLEQARQLAELSRNYEEGRQELTRKRNQEIADYNFRINEERRQEQARYAESQRQQQVIDSQRREEIEKNLAERQAVIAKAEEELKQLRELAAGLDERIKKESEKRAAIEVNSVKRELTNNFALEKKDLEAKLALAQAENLNLAKTVAAVEQRNAALQQQVTEANNRITEISKAAMESASGRQALGAVQEYAGSQPNGGQSSRRQS